MEDFLKAPEIALVRAYELSTQRLSNRANTLFGFCLRGLPPRRADCSTLL